MHEPLRLALEEALSPLGLTITQEQAEKFSTYYEMLVDWNTRMNLTGITDPAEVAQKHFADSLLPLCEKGLLPLGASCIDVGTGAGFPGIPLLIMRPDLRMVLLDSLTKRLKFLEAVCIAAGLTAHCVHARAEEGARKPELRDSFDVVLSRAVAPASVLLELTLPFCKPGGRALCYKGPAVHEELEQSSRALKTLCARVTEVKTYQLPWGERALACLQKTANTPRAYPRKPGDPARRPL